MGRNKLSIAKKLFRTYVVLLGVGFLILLTGTVIYSGWLIYRNITQTQRQLNRNINRNIEHYFQEMDDFSMSLVKNKTFRRVALEDLPEAYRNGQNTVGYFSKLYLEAHEMIQKRYQVGVFTGGGDYIWMGSEYNIRGTAQEISEFYPEEDRDGSMTVSYREEAAVWDTPKVMLSRSFGGNGLLYNGQAVLEIQVEAGDFKEEMQTLSAGKNDGGYRLYLQNDKGEPIYAETDWDAGAFLEANGWREGSYRKDGSYIYVYPILDSKLYTLYTVSYFDYYKRLLRFVAVVIGYFVAVAAAVIWVSYHISRQISKPIHQMCRELGQIDLEKGSVYLPADTDILELNLLSGAIGQLSVKLKESLAHILTLKEHETQSKMMALQAQMQPHFLVNTLMTMGTMAEEAGNQDVFQMCMNLTKMFRYISSEEKDGVRLFEEIQQAERYVDIMQERFPHVRVEMDIPISIMQARIPKLTLQPLVENVFKHSDRSRLCIKVKGTVEEDGRFRILVSDNGNGFTEEGAKEILEKCKNSIDGLGSLSVKVDGMGLVNVYVRLHLFYGEDAVFRIGREGVTIGGRI